MRLLYKILLIALSSVILILTLVGYFGFNYVRSLVEKSIGQSQLLLTKNIGAEIDRLLYERYLDIQEAGTKYIFEQFLANKNLDPVFIQNELNTVAVYTGPWDVLSIIDLTGRVAISTDNREGGEIIKEDPENFKAYSQALTGQTYVSDFTIPEDTGQPTIIFATPIKDRQVAAQPIVGVLIGHLTWPAVTDILKNAATPGAVYLYRQDGVLIGDNEKNRSAESLGKDFKNAPIFQHILNRGAKIAILPSVHSGYASLFTHDALPGYLNYQGNNWQLSIETPINIAFASVSRAGLGLLGFLSPIIFIIGLIIVIVLNYLILRPISFLTSGAKQIAQGNLNQRIRVKSKDELGILAETFNQMAANLQILNRDLEQRVKDKTKELSAGLKQIERKNFLLENNKKAMLNLLEDVEKEKEIAHQEKDKTETILYSIGDGVFVVDADYRIIVFNPVAAKISGHSISEALGKRYDQVLKFTYEESDKAGMVNDVFIKKAMTTGRVAEMANHTILLTKKGQKVPVADSAAPLKDKKGKVVGCVVVFRDVTKEREIDRAKTEFVSVASHQLRTPLTGIKWFTEFLLKSKINARARDCAKQISISNERMVRLVDDLLNVSRIETGRKFDLIFKNTDIVKVIKSAIEEQKSSARDKIIELACSADSPTKLVLPVDELKIRQVFQNLISNSIKYSKEKTKIIIGCQSKGNQTVFFVKDNGIGIPHHQQSQVFTKFFRAENVFTMHTDGTGLGLYIVKAIIEAHGGKIWFESVENKGTTFFVSLPSKNSATNN